VAYVYASNTATTASDGSFLVVVERFARVTPPTTPDTATVELKTYESHDPKAGDRPSARVPVRMNFAEVGDVVPRTVVDVVFVRYPRRPESKPGTAMGN
jgi:hypothetical protein